MASSAQPQEVITQRDMVRLIISALKHMSFNEAASKLETDSQIPLHCSDMTSLTKQVTDEEWDNCLTTLEKMLSYTDETSLQPAMFLILEQQFYDSVAKGNDVATLQTLREMSRLEYNLHRVSELSVSLHMITVAAALAALKKGPEILKLLEEMLPCEIIVPGKTLENLLIVALDAKREDCLCNFPHDFSLFSNNQCGRNNQLPSQTVQVLHGDEFAVSLVRFSHNGKYLASASKVHSAIIWEVSVIGMIHLKHRLTGHPIPVVDILWGPDDCKIITCEQTEYIRLWDVNSGDCMYIFSRPNTNLVRCGWLAYRSETFACLTENEILLFKSTTRPPEKFKFLGHKRGKNKVDMITINEGFKFVAHDTKVYCYNSDWDFVRELSVEKQIMSLSLSDDKFLMIALANEKVIIWNIEEEEPRSVSKYNKGNSNGEPLSQPSLGGHQQGFLAFGKANKVHIYHRRARKVLIELSGHSNTVNNVCWNPNNICMLASASDDATIRIWGPMITVATPE